MSSDASKHFTFVNPLCQFIPKENVKIEVNSKYNRKTLPPDFESKIDQVWQERLRNNPRLFNATKFRLHAAKQLDDSKILLEIGITCYKDFIGTNYSPDAKLLQDLGIQDFGNSQAYLSEALGVGSLLLTSDGYFVIARRSQHVAEDMGLYDGPGGHAEPEEIVGKIPAEDILVDTMLPTSVLDEIFHSIVREVRDEINIPEEFLEQPVMLGILRNPASAGRPTLEFFIRCSLSSSQVSQRYHEGTQAEADESTEIEFIKIENATKSHKLWNQLTHSLKTLLTEFSKLKSC